MPMEEGETVPTGLVTSVLDCFCTAHRDQLQMFLCVFVVYEQKAILMNIH